MNPVKKFGLIIMMIIPIINFAQKVTVSKTSERVKGNDIEGYSTQLSGTIEEVTSAYSKYLKTFGKIKALGSQTQLSAAEVSFTKYMAPLYATTQRKGDKILVWLGLNPGEWPSPEQAESAMKDLEKVVYDFAIKYYRDDIQVDIDESVRAQQAAEKQTLRLQNENKNLNSRLDFNQKEKLRLEKLQAENKLEYETLIAAIAKNKKDQDSVAIATEQIKKMVETHKQRQSKVN
ncbi:MAG TPA: hypothetical protein VFU05_00350 [Cyclobacteriaceae bacterium]|nr:hypothetical protein [Cyclobacteriaceae bacterium]